MKSTSLVARTVALLFAALLAGAACAADVHVISSGGFTAAYKDLLPGFESSAPHKVKSAYGASQGGAPDSIPSRLARGEPADVLIMAAPALDNLIKDGKALPGSRVDLARSTIAMAVRAGAPKPDIGTVDAFKRAMMDAKSIAFSASASGTYLQTELFPKLGLMEQIKGKLKRIESERVGTVVARGDAELGFQQLSELLPIAGIDIVGSLPEAIQQVTIFSAGIAVGSKEPEAARALINYLSSPAAAPVIAKTGLEPIKR